MQPAEDATAIIRRVVAMLHDEIVGQVANLPESQRLFGNLPHGHLYRTAFFAMTRLLLDRAWRDGDCPDFRAPTRSVGPKMGLSPCFDTFPTDEDYAWYSPSEAVRLRATDELACLDLTDVDCDLLGPVYESCLDQQDRRSGGQFYTPLTLVRFLWDRLGFTTPDGMFREESGRIEPRIVADFCMGSGSFLVEAARRIRLAMATEKPRLAASAIVEAISGAEIDGFACYLAQVNLLLQLAPIAKHLDKDLHLSLLHEDALRLFDCRVRACTHALLRRSTARACKHAPYLMFPEVDYVCSNPPYVGEKGHKELFRQVRDAMPCWNEFYQGKMDYFYWFIILGLSKLRQGGRLGYITTAYWPAADGASKLRRYILDHAKIVEMIDFGETPLFPDAPGQHNMIFVLERCDDANERNRNVPKLVQVGPACRAGPDAQSANVNQVLLGKQDLLNHIQSRIDIAPGESYEDDSIRVFWASMPQGDLSEDAWHIFQSDDVEAVLRQIRAAGEPLGRVCEYVQGVVSGADRVTREHFRHLPPELVEQHGIREGDGIFVLGAEELARLQLSETERAMVKPTYKNSQVARYAVDPAGCPPGDLPEYLLYIAPGCGFSPDAAPALFAHLEKFKSVLERKRECRLLDRRTGKPRRQWFELHWPRDGQSLRSEKLVTPRRAAENRFAYVAGGDFHENSDLALLVKRPGIRESLKYILALLNSTVLDFWCEHRGKKKGRIREYYKTPLDQVPIRRIRFEPATKHDLKRSLLDSLQSELDAEQYPAACSTLRQALQEGREDVVHDGMVMLTDRMIDLTSQLASYNGRFGARLTRLRPDDPLPEVKPSAMLETQQIAEEVNAIRRRMKQTQAIVDEVVMGLYGVDFLYGETASDNTVRPPTTHL